MKTIEIKAESRKDTGKKATKQLRKLEHVPCVLYGQGQENIHFHAHKNDFRKLIYTPNSYVIDLNIDDKKCQAIMQSVDFHPVTDELLHIDFYRVDTSKEFKVEIPVRTIGLAAGVQAGGVLRVARRKVLVKALIENMPDELVLDVSDLGIGNAIRVNDLNEKYEDLEFLDPQSIVVTVEVTRLAKSESALEDEEGEEGEEGAEGDESTEGAETTTEDKKEE